MGPTSDDPLSVVLVEDDPVFLEWICAAVARKSNFILFQAPSAAILFDILARERIDCIVLDYDLGDISGFDIKQALDEHLPDHPPVIMMTGDERQRTAILAFRLGIDDYLPKLKLRPEFFVATVSKAVEKRRRAARPARAPQSVPRDPKASVDRPFASWKPL